jgi:hypothetical protein
MSAPLLVNRSHRAAERYEEVDMFRHQHHIIPAVALAVALSAAAPASASLGPNPVPGAPTPAPGPRITSPWQLVNAADTQQSSVATPGPCSEVCSGGGYGSANQAAATAASAGAALPHDPRARSEVVAGGGYGTPNVRPTAVRVTHSRDGFDWGDAGIGAGGALALTMLTAGGVLATTNTRRRARRGSAQPIT